MRGIHLYKSKAKLRRGLSDTWGVHDSTTEAKAEVVKPDGRNEEAGWAMGWGTLTEGPVTLRLLSTFQLDTTREEGGVQACVCIRKRVRFPTCFWTRLFLSVGSDRHSRQVSTASGPDGTPWRD